MAIAPERILPPEYYRINKGMSHAEQEQIASREIPPASDFSKLLTKCLTTFQQSPLRIFPSEGEPSSPRKDKKFAAQAAEVMHLYTHDIFDDQGKVQNGKEQIYSNLLEITPEVLKILISKDNKIDGVQQQHALNTLAASLQMAKDPSKTVGFEIGIGGSTVGFTSARFLVYGLGALNTAEQMHLFYGKRTERVLIAEAVNKKATSEGLERDGTRDRKREIRQEIVSLYGAKKRENNKQPDSVETDLLQLALIEAGLLDQKEIQDLKTKYGILANLPVVKFVFTPHAALFVNYEGQDQQVLDNATRNQAALKSFIDQGSPIASHVYYLTDTPWDFHAPETKLTLEYLAEVLDKSEDPRIANEIAVLRRIGYKHGGEIGARRALVYAAMHKLAFEDPHSVPNPPYMDYSEVDENKVRSLDIVITRGCRREKTFNVLRVAMEDEATVEGFERFLAEKQDKATDPQTKTEAAQARRWLNNNPEGPKGSARIGLAVLDVTAAQAPGYYEDPEDWDIRDRSSLSERIGALHVKIKTVGEGIRRSQLESMVEDLRFLELEMKRRNVTFDMIAA